VFLHNQAYQPSMLALIAILSIIPWTPQKLMAIPHRKMLS
jgi:hypothetical protein